ncbi:(2Fe-2S)-binding protein [Pusillimonas sp. T2]|uniref:(2Fe-2S)-binding protein n=1 Tax=Pusillimonas sp. T2 TaxID=1548123 RepID=UPI0020B15D3A|nr:2Fe-2S iron-sulfur cluster-binding protein [Pusillimonas sp. T2]
METVKEACITVNVNGQTMTRVVPVRRNLVDFLRHDLGLTGTHVGCESGICGACNVRVDGVVVRGCLMFAAQLDGRSVQTIEGVSQSGEAARLQRAFVEHNALQCGYCTPGMLLTGLELVESGREVDRTQIREEISGNFCRCTGYHAIVDAIEEVILERNRNE